MSLYHDVAVAVPDVAPLAKARALAGALRFGRRSLADRIDPRLMGLSVLRTAVDGGTRLLRSAADVRVERVERIGTAPIGGEWARPREAAAGAVLYLHGGGYAFGSPRTHRPMTSRLAADTGLPVLAPDYRLAPEHPFPAAFEDALDGYRSLLDRGVPASRIIVAGDSSGGHLAAAMVGEVCRTGLPRPAGVVLFSPWVDLTCELSVQGGAVCRDPFIRPAIAQHFGRMYAGTHADWSDPRLSLLESAGLDLPPFLIQVAEQEALRGEGERLAGALTAAGNACDLQVWPGQIHVFQIFNRLFPEARAAMAEAADFVRAVLPTEVTGEAA